MCVCERSTLGLCWCVHKKCVWCAPAPHCAPIRPIECVSLLYGNLCEIVPPMMRRHIESVFRWSCCWQHHQRFAFTLRVFVLASLFLSIASRVAFFHFFLFNDSPMCVEQLHFGKIEWVFSLVGRVHSIRHSFLRDDYSASSINCVYSFISIQSTKALKIIFEQPPQNRLKNKFGVLRREIQCHSKNYCKCERDLSNINFHVLSIKFTNHK